MFFGAISSLQSAPWPSGFLKNAQVEAFANHLRNLIVFLYPEAYLLKPDDVAAHHFIETQDPYDYWISLRGPITRTLKSAKNRADKEMAHLTLQRRADGDPRKPWNAPALGEEIRKLLREFVRVADPTRLGPRVETAIPQDP